MSLYNVIPRRCHSTPHVLQLYWLPIKYRIECKVLTFAFKNNFYCQPSISFTSYRPSQSLISDSKSFSFSPDKHQILRPAMFRFQAPTTWNWIPTCIVTQVTLTFSHPSNSDSVLLSLLNNNSLLSCEYCEESCFLASYMFMSVIFVCMCQLSLL